MALYAHMHPDSLLFMYSNSVLTLQCNFSLSYEYPLLSQKDTDEEVKEYLRQNLHLQDKVRWLCIVIILPAKAV